MVRGKESKVPVSGVSSLHGDLNDKHFGGHVWLFLRNLVEKVTAK